jgi:hypothetical protein
LHPDGVSAKGLWLDLGCLAFMIGLLSKMFLKNFQAHPPYPQKDPRMAEGLDVYVPSAAKVSSAQGHAK